MCYLHGTIVIFFLPPSVSLPLDRTEARLSPFHKGIKSKCVVCKLMFSIRVKVEILRIHYKPNPRQLCKIHLYLLNLCSHCFSGYFKFFSSFESCFIEAFFFFNWSVIHKELPFLFLFLIRLLFNYCRMFCSSLPRKAILFFRVTSKITWSLTLGTLAFEC